MSTTTVFIYKSLWWIIPGVTTWIIGLIAQYKGIL